nr:putative ORF1 [Marmot picobirnavirus]AVX53684.1 putative ORF1 [Marmot picobirnavirus]
MATRNQIELQNNIAMQQARQRELEETERMNRARELENTRANQAREWETFRSNLAKERETNRSNVAAERHAINVLSENALHNRVTEANTIRTQSMQSYAQRYASDNASRAQRYASDNALLSALGVASRQVSENARHNRAMEAINDYSARSSASVNKRNAETNYYNALTSRYSQQHKRAIDLHLMPYQTNLYTQQAANQGAQAQYTISKDSGYPVELGYGFLNSMSGFSRAVGGLK